MKHQIVVPVAVLMLGVASVASAEAPCSINTVRATYAFELKGQSFPGGLSPMVGPGGIPMLQGVVLPVYIAGTFTVAADGHASGSYWGLVGAVPVGANQPEPWSATLTIHPDCTGELEYLNAFGGTNVEKLVVLGNGREIRTIALEGATLPWQTTAVRISRTDGQVPMCGPATFRGSYVMRCEGFEGSPGTQPSHNAVSGMFRLDIAADGTLTGRHYGVDHPLEGYETSGTVTVNPDCTVTTIQQTDAVPGATILAKGVLYDNGNEMYGGPLVASFGGQPAIGAFFGFGCHSTRLTR